MPEPAPLPFFVYGTLKRGQVRAGRWPHAPRFVEAATLRGALYDLGPYPALTQGDDVVLGELWHLASEHLAATLAVLDRIECFGVDDVDLYVRIIADVQRSDGSRVSASTYVFANPQSLQPRQRIAPNEHGVCVWPPDAPG